VLFCCAVGWLTSCVTVSKISATPKYDDTMNGLPLQPLSSPQLGFNPAEVINAVSPQARGYHSTIMQMLPALDTANAGVLAKFNVYWAMYSATIQFMSQFTVANQTLWKECIQNIR